MLHTWALNQGFSMNAIAKVAGVKWVRGEITSEGALVQGLHADPNRQTLLTLPGQ